MSFAVNLTRMKSDGFKGTLYVGSFDASEMKDDRLEEFTFFFREVKPFLSEFNDEDLFDAELLFKKRTSPKYGICPTLTELHLRDSRKISVENRCFRVHAGNFATDTCGCFVFSKGLDLTNLKTNGRIAVNTRASIKEVLEVLGDEFIFKVRLLA